MSHINIRDTHFRESPLLRLGRSRAKPVAETVELVEQYVRGCPLTASAPSSRFEIRVTYVRVSRNLAEDTWAPEVLVS